MSSFDDYEMEDKPMQVDKTEYPNYINKVVHGDSLEVLQELSDNSVDLFVTSPPYYNARDYSQYENLNEYLNQMLHIVSVAYRKLKNNHVFVLNVGDIFGNDNLHTKSLWGKRRLPLSAYFTLMFENVGFVFQDDYIWNKGEPQSNRGSKKLTPYPFYQYPINCYEHIIIFHKREDDRVKPLCPECGKKDAVFNGKGAGGINTWECKNVDCIQSDGGRGKRFSHKSNMMQDKVQQQANIIDENIIKKWRKDIVDILPVHKINCKGENVIGHTAPFPKDIPMMAIQFFSYKGDIVCDPFAGSGTTGIACRETGRDYICIEKEKKYVDVMRFRGLSIYGT